MSGRYYSNRDRRGVLAQQRWISAAIVLLAFVVINHLHEFASLSDYYSQLFDQHPYFVLLGGRDVLVVLLCLVVVRLAWATNIAEVVRELGIASPLWPGLVVGLGASMPMFIGFAITSSLASPPATMETLYLSGVSPFAEEILFRAFLCGMLFSRTGLPSWAAVVLSAGIFGWEHVDPGGSISAQLGLFFLTGSGGLVFAWLFLRWRRNIWVPFLLHGAMNLAWNVFNVADSALGGWYAFSLQTASIILAILLTLLWTKPIETPAVRTGRDPHRHKRANSSCS